MKASSRNPKRSFTATKGSLLCFSLLLGALQSSCSDAKDQDPKPQNDTLYALPAGVNAEVKDTFQLGAQRVKGGTATNISDKVMWTSSDPNVVTVDASGKGTATGIGSATVSTTYEGITASVNVKVTGRITSAEVEAAPITLAKGTSYKLATVGLVEDFSKRALTGTQAWGSSNANVATVSADGTVSAKGAGSATIALTYKNVTYPRTVAVLDVPLDSVDVTSDNGTTVPTTMKTTFRLVGTFGGGALTQNITNLYTASISTQDSEFASASATGVTAVALPKDAMGNAEMEKTVVATLSGAKGSIAEPFKKEAMITIIDSKSMSNLAFASMLPATIAVNAEPFTPTFKGTYGSMMTEFPTSPTLSFKGPDDKKYVELIAGAVYPRIAGTVSIIGTMSVTPPGATEAKKFTASADVQIVDAPLMGVNVMSGELPSTTTVGVNKSIKLAATADYGSGLTQNVTPNVVWVSADPSVAMVGNAAGAYGSPGKVTGVSAGGPVDIQAFYRGKMVGSVAVTVTP